MLQAVIQAKGHQFLVKENEEIVISHYSGKKGEEVVLETLLYSDGKRLLVGTPFLKEARVTAKILEHFKGEKLRITRFKAKSRYRKRKGFRPLLTRIRIKEIILREKSHV